MEFPDEYMAFLVVKVTANCCQPYRSPVSKTNWGQLDNSESRTKLAAAPNDKSWFKSTSQT